MKTSGSLHLSRKEINIQIVVNKILKGRDQIQLGGSTCEVVLE